MIDRECAWQSQQQQRQNSLNRKVLYNEGYDDETGDYIVRAGDIINDRYQVAIRQGAKTPLLGKGSFGQVVYAMDLSENLGVALKIIKNQRHFHEQAKKEIELLKKFLKVLRGPSIALDLNSSQFCDILGIAFRSQCQVMPTCRIQFTTQTAIFPALSG